MTLTRSRIRMIVRAAGAAAALFVTLGVDIPATAIAAGSLCLEAILQILLPDSELEIPGPDPDGAD